MRCDGSCQQALKLKTTAPGSLTVLGHAKVENNFTLYTCVTKQGLNYSKNQRMKQVFLQNWLLFTTKLLYILFFLLCLLHSQVFKKKTLKQFVNSLVAQSEIILV